MSGSLTVWPGSQAPGVFPVGPGRAKYNKGEGRNEPGSAGLAWTRRVSSELWPADRTTAKYNCGSALPAGATADAVGIIRKTWDRA